MPSSLERERNQDSRPTLPSIRDLFREELSRRPRLYESPSATLQRLRVSDDDGDHLPRNDPISRPLYQSLPSRHSDTALVPVHQHPQPSGRSHAPLLERSNTEPRSDYHHHGTNAREFNALQDEAFEQGPNTFRRPRHRNTVPLPYDFNDSPALSHGYASSSMTRQRSGTTASEPPRPWNILTTVHSRNVAEDDERTPIARSSSSIAHAVTSPSISLSLEQQNVTEGSSHKYDCSYCGKIFNRPSSLKIHINSHTGEKPFTCPIEGCGRSFSVLSNMRRHTRVHQTTVDTESDSSRPSSSRQSRSDLPSQAIFRRRGSSASTSSTTSRRSYSSISSTER